MNNHHHSPKHENDEMETGFRTGFGSEIQPETEQDDEIHIEIHCQVNVKSHDFPRSFSGRKTQQTFRIRHFHSFLFLKFSESVSLPNAARCQTPEKRGKPPRFPSPASATKTSGIAGRCTD